MVMVRRRRRRRKDEEEKKSYCQIKSVCVCVLFSLLIKLLLFAKN